MMDITNYLPTYKLGVREFAMRMIMDVLHTTGVTVTAGIGSNLYLCKVAMDIQAKRIALKASYTEENHTVTFSDVRETDWSYKSVMETGTLGWISCYEDGTFSPRGNIKRGKTVTVVNRMTGRSADVNYVDTAEGITGYNNLTKRHWTYYEIMEATCGHNYTRKDGDEVWNGLISN